jgi:hypothetical protein
MFRAHFVESPEWGQQQPQGRKKESELEPRSPDIWLIRATMEYPFWGWQLILADIDQGGLLA